MCWGVADLSSAGRPAIPSLIAAMAAIFLISGLFTPVATATIVATQAWIAFFPAFANQGERPMRLFLAAAAASLAMLGPGAWSVDARRFGRQVFEISGPGAPQLGPRTRRTIPKI